MDKILEPCFKDLKCDIVRRKYRQIDQEKPPYGFTNGGSGKPIMYKAHILLSDLQGAADNLGFNNDEYSVIFIKRVDAAIEKIEREQGRAAAMLRRQNLHIIFANISIHEALYHGLLGHSDERGATPGTFSSSAANYVPMALTDSQCQELRDKLQVE